MLAARLFGGASPSALYYSVSGGRRCEGSTVLRHSGRRCHGAGFPRSSRWSGGPRLRAKAKPRAVAAGGVKCLPRTVTSCDANGSAATPRSNSASRRLRRELSNKPLLQCRRFRGAQGRYRKELYQGGRVRNALGVSAMWGQRIGCRAVRPGCRCSRARSPCCGPATYRHSLIREALESRRDRRVGPCLNSKPEEFRGLRRVAPV